MYPLHNHSEFSALDGFSTTKEIADRLSRKGMPGAFLTDHGTVAGWRSFKKAMDDKGLRSGFGVEAYQARVHRADRPEGKNARDAAHLILLAKNWTGAQNIMRMTDESNRPPAFYYHPRIDWDLLERYSDGVLATSACFSGLVPRAIREDASLDPLDRYLKIFGDDFFIEISTYDTEDQHELNHALVGLAKERGIGMVYANDAHYANPLDYHYHEAMVCMQTATNLDDPDRMTFEPCLYIMTEGKVRQKLSHLSDKVIEECISNSDLIADICSEMQFPEATLHLPVYIPAGPTYQTDENGEEVTITNDDLFIEQCELGMDRLLPDVGEEYWDRLGMEAKILLDAGLSDYFLITSEYCQWADAQGIARGPGRGSVGGSLVAYVMGITDIDPLRYGLYFERFYNAGRAEGLPDIDIDFEKARRGEIIEHLRGIYGEHNVIPIGTHIRMKPKAAIDKLTKPLYGKDANYGAITNIKKIIDTVPDIGILSGDLVGWHAADGIIASVLTEFDREGNVVPTEQAELLEPYIKQYPDLFDYAVKIGGRISTYGVHASAVVLSDIDLRTPLPGMYRAPRDDDGESGDRVIATQVEMKEVEKLGFPKFDILGLRTLDTLAEVAPKSEYLAIDWDNMPDEMWHLMDRGRSLGLFQVEEGGAKHIAKKLRPRNMLDLAAVVALNRPGPLRTGATKSFLARRDGEEEVSYTHEILEPLLNWTYGIFLYQEQVIAYARAIGYDLKEADEIRSMLGKKKVAAMKAEHPRYMERATQFMDERTAQAIWDNIIDFSKYSFNLSHAVGYGMILGWTLYAKWKYPTEFIMACIHTNSKRVGEYVAEGRRMGVPIAPPHINESDVFVEKKDGTIYFGLADVKGVGANAAQWIIDHRPYRDAEHFGEVMDNAVAAHKDIPKEDRPARSPRQICTAGAMKALLNAGAFDTLEERELSISEKGQLQQDLLGVVLIDDIEQIVKENADELEQCHPLSDLDDPAYFEEKLRVPGVIQAVRPITSRNGNPMGFVKIEWEGDETEICISPKHWDAYKFLLKPRTVAIWAVTPQERGLSFDGAKKLQSEF